MKKKVVDIRKGRNLEETINLMCLIVKAYLEKTITKKDMVVYFSDLANIIKRQKNG